jgi:hypothetical protein
MNQQPPYPQQPHQQQQQQPYQAPKSNTLKIVLITLGVLLVGGVGSCAACAYFVGSAGKDLVQSIADGGGFIVAAPPEVTAALAGAKKDYVGDWTGAGGSALRIGEDGEFSIVKKENGNSSVNGVIAAFEGDNIVLKMMVKMTYKVTPPKKVGAGFEMVVDGVTYKR